MVGIATCLLFHMLIHVFYLQNVHIVFQLNYNPLSLTVIFYHHMNILLARKPALWSAFDRKRQEKVLKAVQKIPSHLSGTSFERNFPSLVGAICDPDGFNFHERTQNSNGKVIIERLLKASLGMCKSLNMVYKDILVCREQQCFFRIHHTTHSRGQPHSDPKMYHYTGDVVAMAFKTSDEQKAVEWMRVDSPRTPKCVIGDAERSSTAAAIHDKVEKMKYVMKAYSVHGEILGLVLGGNLVLQAIRLKDSVMENCDPLHGMDLSEVEDLSKTLRELNSYLHGACLSMTEQLRLDFPVIRSRSASVVSSPEYSSGHSHYNLRPH